MDIEFARGLIRYQERNIRKVNGMRIYRDGYEYRLTWYGGFACYVGIDRREIGKRNFRYFGGIGACECVTVGQVINKVKQEIERRVIKNDKSGQV